MNVTRQLRQLGQSLWLDNITRALLMTVPWNAISTSLT